MQHAIVNSSGNIWAFMESFIEYSIIRDEEQLITLKLENQNEGMEVFVILVYPKCSQNKRVILWESLGEMDNTMQHP